LLRCSLVVHFRSKLDISMMPRELCVAQHLILGCSSLAGLYSPLPEEDAHGAVHAALAAGVLVFDTAPHYGCGLGEARLGRALKAALDSDAAAAIHVWTKVGRVMLTEDVDASLLQGVVAACTREHGGYEIDIGNVPGSTGCIFPSAPSTVLPVFDYSAAGAWRSCDDSVRRLLLDGADTRTKLSLRVHDCECDRHIAAALADGTGAFAGLVALRAQGRIEHVSLGVNDVAAALRIVRDAPHGTLDNLMIAGSWNLLDHSEACWQLFEECRARGITVHNAAVLASGLLAGGATYRYTRVVPPEVAQRAERWRTLCDEYQVPLPAAAVRFALLPMAVDAVAIGAKNAHEVRDIVSWFDDGGARVQVWDELFVEAQRRGLIGGHVPLSKARLRS